VQSQSVVAGLVLVVLQLLVLRTAQHAVPSLYFTTSSLFDRRRDVSGAAVLFRLSVPFVAGVAVAFLAPEREAVVACAAGTLCWFLVIWPIIWNPRIVGHPMRPAFLAVLGSFWIAFATLPIAGVALGDVMRDVFAGAAPEWQAQYVWAVVTTLPISVGVWGITTLAARRLSFTDDVGALPASEDDTWLDEPEKSGEWWPANAFGSRIPWVLVGLVAGLLIRSAGRLFRPR
jgi:hypothetical protein